jgi:purine-binding chemotaxis protein CheW
MSEPHAKEKKAQIFRNRAKALAAETGREQAGRQGIGVVEIELAHEKYAVESAYVREVLPLKELTPLPGTPAYVLGIINVRGQILSVIDLRVFFELPRDAQTRAGKVIVLKSGDMEVGLAADVVVQARSIPLDEIHPALPTMTGIRETYLRGIAGGDLVILDVGRLLADKSIVVNDETGE